MKNKYKLKQWYNGTKSDSISTLYQTLDLVTEVNDAYFVIGKNPSCDAHDESESDNSSDGEVNLDLDLNENDQAAEQALENFRKKGCSCTYLYGKLT